jgi:hypothetical protein
MATKFLSANLKERDLFGDLDRWKKNIKKIGSQRSKE